MRGMRHDLDGQTSDDVNAAMDVLTSLNEGEQAIVETDSVTVEGAVVKSDVSDDDVEVSTERMTTTVCRLIRVSSS